MGVEGNWTSIRQERPTCALPAERRNRLGKKAIQRRQALTRLGSIGRCSAYLLDRRTWPLLPSSRSSLMAGRPSLRIGQHGKIKRIYLGAGVWLARCRYRDTDGVTRIVQRVGPSDEFDKRGKLAEDALIEALAERRPPSRP